MDDSHIFQDKVEGEGDMQLGGVYTIPGMWKVAGGQANACAQEMWG